MSRIPTKDEVLQWISDNPTSTSKRDIARAFGIKGAARIDLKRVLKELEAEGHLQKRRKTYRDPDTLPPVSVLRVIGPDKDGDILVEPVQWEGEGAAPTIIFIEKRGDPALGSGDRILGRLTKLTNAEHDYEARLIRRLNTGAKKILGVFRKGAEGGRIAPIDKGEQQEWRVPPGAVEGAKDGELVEAEQTGPKGSLGLPIARIIARLGDPSDPRAVSLIAIHQHGIPDDFPQKTLDEAEAGRELELGQREDLRDLPLITIDPWDARDHDDACYAHADDDPKNEGGHIVWVAIADVAQYVRPGSALDIEARKRGNSTYFPDRVVPMLPDTLSADLCSLHEGVDRPCMAVRMVLDAKGNKLSHRFTRAIMHSPASLNYEEVQAGMNGDPNPKVAPMMETVIRPLFDAYHALLKARAARDPLNLDLPERQIVLSDEGKVTSVAFKDRIDAHKVIEEFMVLANVAAAEELISKKAPVMFRVHEEPSPEKLEALREVAQAAGLNFPKGQVLKTKHINALLKQAEGSEDSELINISALRSMTQAYYGPENFGHFGLALKNYAHFTSPIRRYSDLLVHRALITAHGWGDDGLAPETAENFRQIGEVISEAERRSMLAERDTIDRYLASYLTDRVGAELTGRIASVVKFGLFVKLDESGADGLVPVRSLGREFFVFDRDAQTLTGEKSGLVLGLGQKVIVKLAEATPVTGGIVLELMEAEGKSLPRSSPNRRTVAGKRAANRQKRRASISRKKAKRRR